ncbi:MAG: hypothetical protein R2838_03230 [Caldilineaceae bacterium]
MEDLDAIDIPIRPIPDLTPATLRDLDAAHADAIITLLANDESYQVCESPTKSSAPRRWWPG